MCTLQRMSCHLAANQQSFTRSNHLLRIILLAYKVSGKCIHVAGQHSQNIFDCCLERYTTTLIQKPKLLMVV